MKYWHPHLPLGQYNSVSTLVFTYYIIPSGSQCVTQKAICSYIKVCVHKTGMFTQDYHLFTKCTIYHIQLMYWFVRSINYYLLYIVHVNVNLHLHLTVFFDWSTQKRPSRAMVPPLHIQTWIYIQQWFFFPCNIVI